MAAILLCVFTEVVGHGNHQRSIGLEAMLKGLEIAMQIMNVFEHMPHGDGIKLLRRHVVQCCWILRLQLV